MKFCDFWFEVPSAFINLLKNTEFMSIEVNKYSYLLKTYKVFHLFIKGILYSI